MSLKFKSWMLSIGSNRYLQISKKHIFQLHWQRLLDSGCCLMSPMKLPWPFFGHQYLYSWYVFKVDEYHKNISNIWVFHLYLKKGLQKCKTFGNLVIAFWLTCKTGESLLAALLFFVLDSSSKDVLKCFN